MDAVTNSGERCDSYYSASVLQESDYPALDSEHRVDVAIIGGGFTGTSTAVGLAERGYKVALIEARKIGWGASGRNGGQVTGSLSGDQAMKRQLQRVGGTDAEEFIWRLRWRGHQIISDRVEKYNISCDLKHGHLQAAYKPSHVEALRREFDGSQREPVGGYIKWLGKDEISSVVGTRLYHSAIRNDYNMHIHPLNLCLGEARAAVSLGVLVFEHSPVVRIDHGNAPVVVTARGCVRADSILIAGGAYHKLERRTITGRMFPASLGIVTTEPLSPEVVESINPLDLAVYDSRVVLDYYRLTADKRLLFGGGANYSGHASDNIARELRPNMERTFPQLKGARIDFQWCGNVGIVINRIPYLGKIADNIYFAQGYSGHGIATSHVMGEVLADAISGTMERFDTFAEMKRIRIPFNDQLGNTLLTVGMWYYRLLERFR